ncbi:MAG TPA: inorganic phosphate transporter [Candidatus Deferrimicrobium sp.]|nr:inorganic phosphate transporter [Candidatus Deferrimicrobium sp.]
MNPMLLLIVLMTLSVVIAFGIGANDEALAPVVGSGAVKLKYVLYLALGLNIVGAVLLGGFVSQTLGSELLQPVARTENFILAIIISTSIFLILSSFKGIPVSTTVSVVGSVIGVGLYYLIINGTDVVIWGGFTEVALGWIISPILGFVISIGIYWLIRRYILTIPKGLKGIEKMEQFFLYGLIVMVVIVTLSRAGNDVGNAVGVLTGFEGSIDLPSVTILLLIGGIGIGVGVFVLGRRVLRTVGKNIIEMRPSDAFAVQTATMIILLTATLLGLPVSGTVILIFAIIGNSVVKRTRFNKKTVKQILYSWGLTIPVTLAVSIGICALLFAVNPI